MSCDIFMKKTAVSRLPAVILQGDGYKKVPPLTDGTLNRVMPDGRYFILRGLVVNSRMKYCSIFCRCSGVASSMR